VPLRNEAHHLEGVLERCFAAPCPIQREFILVDDGSTDGSGELCDAIAGERDDTVVIRQRQRGKGAAVRSAIRAASGDFIMIQDADYEYDPNDIPALLAPLLADSADVVFGSRFRRERVQVHRTHHFQANRLLTATSNMLSGIYLTDTHSCYKVFRADLLKAMRLRSPRFGFEAESVAYVAKTSARMVELPVAYAPRTKTTGKKIGWRDGIAAFGHYIVYNLLTSSERAFRDLPDRYLPRA
jgi:glycosyltransferase involved in cell wall biosynthesis